MRLAEQRAVSPHATNVKLQPILAAFDITGFECVNDALMLGNELSNAIWFGQAQPTHPVELDLHRTQRPPHTGIAAEYKELLVHQFIGAEKSGNVSIMLIFPLLINEPTHFAHIAVVALSGHLERANLEQFAHKLRLGHCPHWDRVNDRTNLRLHRHEPVVHEAGNGLADRGSADLELFGQVWFAEFGARRQAQISDGVKQLRIHQI